MQVSKKREIASADVANRGENRLALSTVVRCKFFNGSFRRSKRGGFPVSTISSPLNLMLASANSCSLPATSIFIEFFFEVAVFFKNLIQIFDRVIRK